LRRSDGPADGASGMSSAIWNSYQALLAFATWTVHAMSALSAVSSRTTSPYAL
jgi:hypothetical protein